MAKAFMKQAAFADYRGVSRKTVTVWKQRGYLVLDRDGRIDVAKSDDRLRAAGIVTPLVTGNSEGNRGNTPPSRKGYELLDQIEEPFDAGMMAMGLRLFYALPSQAAIMAVHSGASCEAAYALKKAMTMALMIEIGDSATAAKIGPWKNNPDPDVWQTKLVNDVNWASVAGGVGEPVDIPAWERYAAARLGGS